MCSRPTPVRAPWVADRAFAIERGLTLTKLVRLGIPSTRAEAWVHAWDVMTAGLVDFRRASDFWELGYQYAVEEYRLGFDPPEFAVRLPRADVRRSDQQAQTG